MSTQTLARRPQRPRRETDREVRGARRDRDERTLQAARNGVLGHEAAFVFAYRVLNVDVDFDGRESLLVGRNRYLFWAVRVDDYARHMKRRSPKWRTVTLPADAFREVAIDPTTLLQL